MTSPDRSGGHAERAPLVVRAYRHSAVRFLFFSGVGYSFDLTVLLLLERAGRLPLLANVTIAFVLTYALNFALNRWFAFHAAHRDLRGQLGRYLPQVTVDYLLTLGGVWLFAAVLGLPLFWARLLAATTNLIFNYTVYRFWTFRRAATVAAPQVPPAPEPVP
ncbi:MAG: GtrA family protein [Kineosporiaceae bacterium]